MIHNSLRAGKQPYGTFPCCEARSRSALNLCVVLLIPLTPPSPSPALLQVLLSLPCALVTAKRKLAGRLELTRSSLHFYVEFVVDGNKSASLFDDKGQLRHDFSAEAASPQEGSRADETGRPKKGSAAVGGQGLLRSPRGVAGKPVELLNAATTKSSNFQEDVKRHRSWPLLYVSMAEGGE